ncbi:MAG: ATP-binding protein [Sedimenticola sp.]
MLLAMFPLIVMTSLLGYHLIDSRLEDSRRILVERGDLMVRHLALSSEFGLFSHDNNMLRSIVESLAFDEDVKWAAVLDGQKRLMAYGGFIDIDELNSAFTLEGMERPTPSLFLMPIGVLSQPYSNYSKEEIEEMADRNDLGDSWPLGWAVICLSVKTIEEKQEKILFSSLILIVAGMLASILIALSVGKKITDPIRALIGTVERLQHGDLSVRVERRSEGELGNLEIGFNEMAASLQDAQENLEQQVDSATQGLQHTVELLKSKNKALGKARLQALQASRDKAQFLARMSHEIRTPLNAVVGFSRLLNEAPDSMEAEEYLRAIDMAAKQLFHLIDDILQFSRLEAGHLELERIDFELPVVLEDVVGMLTPSANEKGLELVLLMHNDLPHSMRGDPTRFSQILTNLLNNAIKFTDDGHVFVEADCISTQAGRQVNIRVSDTGIGIAEEEKERLFSAFTQADDSITRRFGGNGLGLVISERLVSLMGGTIGVQSQKGKGSVFYFTIPCSSVGKGLQIDLEADFSGNKVLVYDKHPLSRRALRSTMLHWKFSVSQTGDFDELMGLASPRKGGELENSLVVLGLGHEECSSETFPEMFSSLCDVYKGPVLIMTGDIHWRPPVSSDSLCDVAWSSKPARRKIVLQKIHKLLGKPSTCKKDQAVNLVEMADFDGIRILSAEDNEFNRLLIRRLLEERGVTVCEACTGQEAIDCAVEDSFDLIIMDIHMPGMDGFTAATLIRSVLGDNCPPILSLSADVFASSDQNRNKSVFDDNLIKPVTVELLESAITTWVLDGSRFEFIDSREGEGMRAEESMSESNAGINGLDSAGELRLSLPPDMESMLYSEITRLHDDLIQANDQAAWEEFAELSHQLCGLSGLYGFDELADAAMLLEQSARNNLTHIIPASLEQLSEAISQIGQVRNDA